MTTVGKQTMGKGRPARVMKILLPEGILEKAEQPGRRRSQSEAACLRIGCLKADRWLKRESVQRGSAR